MKKYKYALWYWAIKNKRSYTEHLFYSLFVAVKSNHY